MNQNRKPNIKIKNIFRHLKTIHTHRKWVKYYCFQLGLYRQGWLHELSKYSPTEFWESVRYYQGTSSPIDASKKANGYSPAWFHHRGRNLHHNVCWIDNINEGVKPVRMPFDYVCEMICDWMAAGRAYMGDDFSYAKEYDWYRKRTFFLHPHTKRLVDEIMTFIVRFGDDAFSYGLWEDMMEEFYIDEENF